MPFLTSHKGTRVQTAFTQSHKSIAWHTNSIQFCQHSLFCLKSLNSHGIQVHRLPDHNEPVTQDRTQRHACFHDGGGSRDLSISSRPRAPSEGPSEGRSGQQTCTIDSNNRGSDSINSPYCALSPQQKTIDPLRLTIAHFLSPPKVYNSVRCVYVITEDEYMCMCNMYTTMKLLSLLKKKLSHCVCIYITTNNGCVCVHVFKKHFVYTDMTCTQLRFPFKRYQA